MLPSAAIGNWVRKLALSCSSSAGGILAITCPAGPIGTRFDAQKSSNGYGDDAGFNHLQSGPLP